MPRMARVICPQVPYHVTQRGNRREAVFFTRADRTTYLKWLSEYADEHRVAVLAYCLMTNHVHLVLVPDGEAALSRVLKPLHMRYAQRINRGKGWKGHLWQGRYFSSALDEDYLWAAIRYVERNPVCAKLAAKAEDYPWSSAAGHCGTKNDGVRCNTAFWGRQFESIGNWSSWLAMGDEPERLAVLRRNADKGLPCGSGKFIHGLEKLLGRDLAFRPRGRRRKQPEKG